MKTLSALALALLLGANITAMAQEINLQIRLKNHRFEPSELKAPAGRPIVLRVINDDASPEEFESKDLRVERVIAANAESIFKLRPLQPGRYQFFGEFNEATAQGSLLVE